MSQLGILDVLVVLGVPRHQLIEIVRGDFNSAEEERLLGRRVLDVRPLALPV